MRSRNSVTRLAPSLGFLRLLKKKRAIARRVAVNARRLGATTRHRMIETSIHDRETERDDILR
jgi:hypothetical protein